jgi:hypothetical protein
MWKSNRKTTSLLFFLDSLFPKNRDTYAIYFVLRQNSPDVKYSTIWTSGGGGMFLGEISSSRRYSKKDYKGKKKEQHRYKIRTWNVITLKRGENWKI